MGHAERLGDARGLCAREGMWALFMAKRAVASESGESVATSVLLAERKAQVQHARPAQG